MSQNGFDPNRSWAFPAEFIFSNAQLTDLTSLNGFKAISIVGGGTLDLSHLASLTSATWTIGTKRLTRLLVVVWLTVLSSPAAQ